MKAFHYTEVPSQPVEGSPGVTIRWAIGRNVGAPNFVSRVIDIGPGSATEHHSHPWEHEVFVVEGAGTVYSAEGESTIGPGSCVYVEPREIHHFSNTGDSVLRIVCVIPFPPES